MFCRAPSAGMAFPPYSSGSSELAFNHDLGLNRFVLCSNMSDMFFLLTVMSDTNDENLTQDNLPKLLITKIYLG